MEEYETVLLVKPEVFVYRIPPRATSRGYRAADWKLDAPDWTGRMRLVVKGDKCVLKLEDKNTGGGDVMLVDLNRSLQTKFEKLSQSLNMLFAKSPIDKYPGIALEPVLDSSRYFVLRLEDDNGRSAFIGFGFGDRGDAFDLNVALQDHFKWLQKSEEIQQGADASDSKPNLDLSFKDGQTITINMNIGKRSGSAKPRPKSSTSGAIPGLLPPPPGGVRTSPTSGPKPLVTATASSPNTKEKCSSSTALDANSLLLDLDSPGGINSAPSGNPVSNTAGNDLWGDFTAASSNETKFP